MKYLFIFRKIYCFLSVILLLLTNSCSEDILNEKPLDFLAPESAYNNPAGIRQGINGLHVSVREYWYASNDEQYPMTFGDGTDLCYYGEAPGGATKLANYQVELTPQNDRFSAYWERNYIIIQRANVLIEAIKSANSSIWVTEIQKNAYLAEAMFFRAYAYRM
jgi:starch-binding outer membrane protein, SusD/RagB family